VERKEQQVKLVGVPKIVSVSVQQTSPFREFYTERSRIEVMERLGLGLGSTLSKDPVKVRIRLLNQLQSIF